MYKRQGQIDRHFFKSASDDPHTWTDLPTAVRTQLADTYFPTLIAPLRVQTADAVSYTHLDVYKRQPPGWLGRSSSAPGPESEPCSEVH